MQTQAWDSCLIDGVPTLWCVQVLFGNILAALGGLIFLILFAMFLIGSFNWLTAGDDAQKLKKAKGTFFSAIVGLIIIVAAYLVLNILGSITGQDLTKFQIPTS